MGDNSYGDEIWCCMAFCAQVEGIGVGGGCDCILVRKITVRQPDHSGQPSNIGLICYRSRLPYNLHCVGADRRLLQTLNHAQSINQSATVSEIFMVKARKWLNFPTPPFF